MSEAEKVLAEVSRGHELSTYRGSDRNLLGRHACICGELGPRMSLGRELYDWHRAHLAHEQAKAIEARVLPSVEDVARVLFDHAEADMPEMWRSATWDDMGGAEPMAERAYYESAARAVLAMLPGRTEAEVKAEALREYADTRGVNVGDDDDEWWQGYRQAQRECFHDARDRADQIERGLR